MPLAQPGYVNQSDSNMHLKLETRLKLEVSAGLRIRSFITFMFTLTDQLID